MNTPIKNIFLLFSLLLSAVPSNAQALSELLQSFEKGNRQLALLEVKKETLQARELAANHLAAPEIGLGLWPIPIETRLGPQQLRLSAKQSLPFPGFRPAKRSLAFAETQVAAQQIGVVTQQMSHEFVQLWLVYYGKVEEAKLLALQAPYLQNIKKGLEARMASAEASLAEVLSLDLELESLAQEQANNLLEQQRLRQQLNTWLRQELTTEIYLADSLAWPKWEYHWDTLALKAAERNPLYRHLAAMQTQSQAAETLASFGAKPTWSLGVDYLMVGMRTDASPIHNGRDALQINLSLSVPLNTARARAERHAQQRTQQALLEEKKILTDELALQYHQAQTAYRQAEVQRDWAQAQLKNSSALIVLAEAEYIGTGEGFETLLRLQKNKLDYQVQALSALIRACKAQAVVDYLIKTRN